MKQIIKRAAKQGVTANHPYLGTYIAIAEGYAMLYNIRYPRTGICANTAAISSNPWQRIVELLSRNTIITTL